MNDFDLSANRLEERKRYYNIWQRYKNNELLEGEDDNIAGLMALHKDWYGYWDSTDFEREFNLHIDELNPFLHITFDSVIMNQINNSDPEQARDTYNKLTAGGDSHLEAIHKMVDIFLSEYWEIMRYRKKFNLKRYTRKLKELK